MLIGKGETKCKEPTPIPQILENGQVNPFFHKSLIPGHTYTYGFVGNWTDSSDAVRQLGVKDAFDAWSAANTAKGLAVKFEEVQGGATANIQVGREFITPITAAGNFIPQSTGQQNGHIVGGNLHLTTYQFLLSDRTGYRRATLHEIGHTLGLWHTTLDSGGHIRGESVMNPLGGRNDIARNIPDVPTACDVQKALEYSTP